MTEDGVEPQAAANPFDTEVAARLYAAGRPYFHEQVAGRIRDLLSITAPVARENYQNDVPLTLDTAFRRRDLVFALGQKTRVKTARFLCCAVRKNRFSCRN